MACSSLDSTEEIIGHSEDLMTQIALYLPVKSILCFRTVSKQWYSLLTHPQFIKHHASFQETTNSFLFLQSSNYRLYIYIEPLCNLSGTNHNVDTRYLEDQYNEPFIVEASCKGLLLLKSMHFMSNRRRFFVSNPSTRKSSELAVPNCIATAPLAFSNLAFDPSTSPYYKVIFIWKYDPNDRDYNITIYSSETNTFRKLGYTYETRSTSPVVGYFFKGAVFWIDMFCPRMTFNYFDISQESINEFPRLPDGACGNNIRYFGGYRGQVYLILRAQTQTLHDVLDVYVLKEDYSSWGVKYKVDMDAIAIEFPEIIENWYYFHSPILCVIEDEEEPSLVLHVGSCQVLAYNFMSKTTKKLGKFRYASNKRGFHFVELRLLFGRYGTEFRLGNWQDIPKPLSEGDLGC